jgi:hypothetical protein
MYDCACAGMYSSLDVRVLARLWSCAGVLVACARVCSSRDGGTCSLAGRVDFSCGENLTRVGLSCEVWNGTSLRKG